MIRFSLLVVFITLALSKYSHAGVSAYVLSYGIYKSTGKAEVEIHSGTATGYATLYDDFILISKTRDIPGIRCISFGYIFRIDGLPDVETDYIEVTVHHPLMNNYLGMKSYSSTITLEIYPKDGSYEDASIYTMRRPYEVLHGKWVLEIKYKDKLLISESFLISKEENGVQPNKKLECDAR